MNNNYSWVIIWIGSFHYFIFKTSITAFAASLPLLYLFEAWFLLNNVIIEFPTYEKALEWYNSDLYKPVKELRQKNSEGNLIIIKGV